MSRPITTFSISLALSFFLMVQACNSSEVTLEKTMEITPNTSKEKTLLAVFAHPDDESTVGPVLAKYVREGATVHLVIATDGICQRIIIPFSNQCQPDHAPVVSYLPHSFLLIFVCVVLEESQPRA